tara:strand:+ start:108 stop:275 length:168 start_codon:yes stop_codon:yes gene_type:complete
MSKRNGKNKTRLAYLDEINQIDKRLKKRKVRESEEETSKLVSKRNTIRQRLKTSK